MASRSVRAELRGGGDFYFWRPAGRFVVREFLFLVGARKPESSRALQAAPTPPVHKATWNRRLVHRRAFWRVLAACWYIESGSVGGVLAVCWYIESSSGGVY